MHIANWRLLPMIVVLAFAGLLFWALLTVFGSQSNEPEQLPNLAAQDNLIRVPLEFPDVAKPLIEAIPSPLPEPSPEQAAAVSPTRPRSRSTTTTTDPPRIPTDGATGDAVIGESGGASTGAPDTSGIEDDDDDDDDEDLVPDIDDEFDPDDVDPDEDNAAGNGEEDGNGEGSEEDGSAGSSGDGAASGASNDGTNGGDESVTQPSE